MKTWAIQALKMHNISSLLGRLIIPSAFFLYFYSPNIMTQVLQSFIGGRWIGSQAAAPLHSAINGTVVAHAHADSLDFAEALHFARATGLTGMFGIAVLP